MQSRLSKEAEDLWKKQISWPSKMKTKPSPCIYLHPVCIALSIRKKKSSGEYDGVQQRYNGNGWGKKI